MKYIVTNVAQENQSPAAREAIKKIFGSLPENGSASVYISGDDAKIVYPEQPTAE